MDRAAVKSTANAQKAKRKSPHNIYLELQNRVKQSGRILASFPKLRNNSVKHKDNTQNDNKPARTPQEDKTLFSPT